MLGEFEISPPMNRILKTALRAALAALVLVMIVYAGDSVSVKYRMSRFQHAGNSAAGGAGNPSGSHMSAAPKGPLDTVQIEQIYEIPHKDGRAEFAFGEPQNITCVHSLFPHLGYSPCWYVKRHKQQMIPM
jgi:hypothetical protein